MKIRLWISAMLIALGLMGLNYWFTLEEETSLPSNNWSRSFPVDAPASSFSNIQIVEEESGYTISLRDFKNQYVLGCDEELACEHLHTYDIFTTTKNTWSDQEEFYYYRNGALIRKSASGEETIAEDIDNFVKNKERLVYWTKEQEVVVDGTATVFPEPIYDVKLLDELVLVVTKDKTENDFTVYELAGKAEELFDFQFAAMDIVNSLGFIPTEEGYSMLAETTLLAGGAKTKTIQLAPFTLETDQQLAFAKLEFVNEENGRKLPNVGTPSLASVDGATYVAFSSSNRLYAGELKDETVVASAINKAGSHNDRPTMLNEDTVLFFDINGSKKDLHFASSNPALIAESEKLQDGDLKEALYTMLSKVFNGFMILVFSVTWIVASLMVTFGMLFILQKKKTGDMHKRVFLVFAALLFIFQAFFFTQMISTETLLATLPLVESSWHLVGVLLGATLLSIVPLKVGNLRVNEDSFNFSVMFVTLFNLVILCLLIGPYLY